MKFFCESASILISTVFEFLVAWTSILLSGLNNKLDSAMLDLAFSIS